jgi:uncharacterized protein YuzE
MRITYDPWADAVSFHIGSPEKGIVDYADVDGDTFIHFDPDNRIVAMEILGASRRLDLDFLLPEITLLGDEGYQTWRRLQVALWRRKQAGQPIIAGAKEKTYWISQIENHSVTLIAESVSVTISEQDLDNLDIASHKKLTRGDIVEALWELGQYHSGSA